MAASLDYYEVLRIDVDADDEAIEAAFRRLALEIHPDRNRSPDATRQMQELIEARDTLLDPYLRALHNLDRQKRTNGAGSAKRSERNPPEHANHRTRQTASKPDEDYVLRFGSYKGQTLKSVFEAWPSYLSTYLRVKMGDVAERNAIRAFLGLSESEWESEPAETRSSKENQEEEEAGRDTRTRPNNGYTLRYGMYARRTLQWVFANHPAYLTYYLKAGMGDVRERNCIRAFLFISTAEWEKDQPSAQRNARSSPPRGERAEPRSQGAEDPGDYVLKYGAFAGKRIAEVHSADPNHLKGYLERMLGTTDERAMIGRFLGVNPLEVRAEYMRGIQVPAPQAVSSQRSRQTDESGSHVPWKGALIVVGLIGFFVAAAAVAPPGQTAATPTAARSATLPPIASVPPYPYQVPTVSVRTVPPVTRSDIPIPTIPALPTFNSRLLTPIPTFDRRFLTPIPTIGSYTFPAGSSYSPMPGSWVAYQPDIAIRFYAMPWWVEQPQYSGPDRLSLGSSSTAEDFEAVDIYRFRGVGNSADPRAWQAEYDGYTQRSAVANPAITSSPRPQKAAGYDGYIGQYHYFQSSNDLQIDVTMWVGQVNGDSVVMIFRCEPARDADLDRGVAEVLATIDFNAR